MTTLKQRRRRQTWVAFGAGVLVLTMLPVSVVVAWRAIRDSKAAQEVVALPSRGLPTTPTAILAVTDEQNFLTSISIVALTPEGAKALVSKGFEVRRINEAGSACRSTKAFG